MGSFGFCSRALSAIIKTLTLLSSKTIHNEVKTALIVPIALNHSASEPDRLKSMPNTKKL